MLIYNLTKIIIKEIIIIIKIKIKPLFIFKIMKKMVMKRLKVIGIV